MARPVCKPAAFMRSAVQRRGSAVVQAVRSPSVSSKISSARLKAGKLRQLFPATQPHNSGYLRVSETHTIAYWQYGNPLGPPAVVLHGGPGAGSFPNHARFFDPAVFNVVLVDQRGCGASTPVACIIDNTTADLVSDLEKLRKQLGFSSWLLFGGSWGVTLALAYSIAHPERVQGLVLRGICLMRRREIDWVFRGGCEALFPGAWASFAQDLSDAEAKDPLAAFYARLTAEDATVRAAAVQRVARLQMALSLSNDKLQVWDGSQSQWSSYMMATFRRRDPPSTAKPVTPQCALPAATAAASAAPSEVRKGGAPSQASPAAALPFPEYSNAANPLFAGVRDPQQARFLAQQLLTLHYSMHDGFLNAGGESSILRDIGNVRHIPAIAVHGRADMVCPIVTAYDLHNAWPELEVQVVPGAGHSMYDPKITDCLLRAIARMSRLPRILQ